MRPSATLLFWNVELCARTLFGGPCSHWKICSTNYLLGGLLLLLLLLLGVRVLLLFNRGLLNNNGLLSLGLLLDGDEQANDVLGLDHVVLIDLELTEDVVDLALVVVGLEGLDDEVIGVVALASHLLLEHLGHVLAGAGAGDLSQQTVELGLGHEHADVVEGAAQVVLVELAILVDVHELEAVLVHLDLLIGEAALILALTHLELLLCTGQGTTPHV